MNLNFIKKYGTIALLAGITFTSCNKDISPDKIIPTEATASLYFGSDNRTLYSYNINTFDKNWEFLADNAIKASPVVHSNYVFVVTEGGTLSKIDKITGKELQKRLITGGVIATPTTFNNYIIIGTLTGNVLVLDINDIEGEPFWNASGHGMITSSLTVEAFPEKEGSDKMLNFVYGCNVNNQIFALFLDDDKLKGTTKWKRSYTPAGSMDAGLTVTKSALFATSTNGFLYHIDPVNGNVRWNFKAKAKITSSPICIGGNVLFGSYDMNFYSVDSTKGTERWVVNTTDAIESTPSYDPQTQLIFFGSNDHYIYGVDILNGDVAWRKRTFSAIRSSAVAANGRVYVASYDKNMYVLNAKTGDEIKQLPVYGQMSSSPILDNLTRIYYPPISGNHFLK